MFPLIDLRVPPHRRAAFLELVKDADIVLENNSARVMPNLGLSYEEIKAVNPSVIMCSNGFSFFIEKFTKNIFYSCSAQ